MARPMPTVEELRQELERALPGALPRRAELIAGEVRHLAAVIAANERVNVTRIVTAADAAVRHVWDSVRVWPLLADLRAVLDLGSGGGFPGVPLALVLPDVHFVLAESVRKKARILAGVVGELGLPNVEVVAERGEAWLAGRHVDAILARAVAPARRLLHDLRGVGGAFDQLLLWKGPEAAAELADARALAARLRLRGEVVLPADLPVGAGRRVVLSFVREPAGEREDGSRQRT